MGYGSPAHKPKPAHTHRALIAAQPWLHSGFLLKPPVCLCPVAVANVRYMHVVTCLRPCDADAECLPPTAAPPPALPACTAVRVLQNNDVTRVRADVAGLWFQSSVSPRLAVRVLQAVVIAIILKFHAADSYSIGFW